MSSFAYYSDTGSGLPVLAMLHAVAYVRTIVCLASSQKVRGRCIAGREVLVTGGFGAWIRPVGARASAAVVPAECRYADNTLPKPLDIVDVPLWKVAPAGPQTENHVLDPAGRWRKRGELSWDHLERLCNHPPSLWLNGPHTQQGTNDCLSPEEAESYRRSLFLIRPKSFTVEAGHKVWEGVRSRTFRGLFNYYGTHYNLSVTDPAVRNFLATKPENQYIFADVYLCISLTEPYDEDGRCHKLVAAVIRNPPL
jgi:hypothetical protein